MKPRLEQRPDAVCALLLLGVLLTGACDRIGPSGRVAADDELALLVDSMLPSLGRLASLEPREPVRMERRDREGVRRYVEDRLEQELPEAELIGLHATYAQLGLIPDTLDLRALLLELYTEQIVGYYDPEDGTLYVVEGASPELLQPVLAHELVHALQDQYAPLDSLIARERGGDRQAAAHAALEGHATLVMYAYQAEQLRGERVDPATLPNPADQIAVGYAQQSAQFPVLARAPLIVRETMLFPYIGGSGFVYGLWQAEPLDRPAPLGRWLPQSTEQVLHPEDRFLRTRDEPTELRFDSVPSGWTVLRENTLGQLETGLLLEQHAGVQARAGARGWDGDRYRMLEGEAGERALIWFSVWDDSTSAGGFRDALTSLTLPGRTLTTEALQLDGRPMVRAIIAPAEVTLPDSLLTPPRLLP
jgi:hypothetical protein